MEFDRRICVAGACALAAWTAFGALAQAQPYPAKPIHIIVPLPPGGSNDVLARLLGQKMSESFGQPVIVEVDSGKAVDLQIEEPARDHGPHPCTAPATVWGDRSEAAAGSSKIVQRACVWRMEAG